MFDVNGAELGIYIGLFEFFHEPTEVIVSVERDGSLATPTAPTVLYELLDCSGTAMIEADTAWPSILYSTREGLVAVESATLPSIKTFQSGRNTPGGQCFQQTGDRLVFSTRSIVFSDFGLTFPLPTPLYVGLPPE